MVILADVGIDRRGRPGLIVIVADREDQVRVPTLDQVGDVAFGTCRPSRNRRSRRNGLPTATPGPRGAQPTTTDYARRPYDSSREVPGSRENNFNILITLSVNRHFPS